MDGKSGCEAAACAVRSCQQWFRGWWCPSPEEEHWHNAHGWQQGQKPHSLLAHPCSSGKDQIDADNLKDLCDTAMIINSRTGCSRSLALQMGSNPGVNMWLYFCHSSQKGTTPSYATLMFPCRLNVTWKRIKKTSYRKKVAQMIITWHDKTPESTKLTRWNRPLLCTTTMVFLTQQEEA